MLDEATFKQLQELHAQNRSIRDIARILRISRNTVRKYVRTPVFPIAKVRRRRPSKLDPFRNYVQDRVAAGVENCVVLLWELRALAYTGGYSILTDFVCPLRRRRVVTRRRSARRRKLAGHVLVDASGSRFLPVGHWP
jgi:transposase